MSSSFRAAAALLTLIRIAQARTGTGKTLAFLIPVLQNIISFDPSLESSARRRAFDSSAGSRCDIRAIIISPTRELAEQIAAEAQKVVRDTGVIVQTAVGGSSKQIGLQRIVRNGCHILVATPGRLNDILSDPRSGVRAPNLSALVLDEADRLLDQGFSVELQEIQKLLPNRREVDRQTLLFSATIPREVMDIARHTMKPDFKYVRTVQEGEQQTHERIPQMVVTVPGYENMWPALLELCQKEMSRKGAEPFKAIVYMNATAEVSLGASIFRNLKEPGASTFQTHPLHPARIIEIHARLTQAQRTRAADAFRAAKSAIMFSSDVTARGMDFPNVTHVIQVGIPSNRDTYIHRVGRTGRGDKKGEGWLFTTDMESRELRSRLFKLPLKQDQSLEAARVDMSRDTTRSPDVDAIFNRITTATKPVPFEMKSKAFISSFGIYAWMPQKSALVEALNRRAKYEWDMDTPPAVSPNLASKLGFSRVPGINVGHDDRMPMFSRDDAPGFGRGRSSSGYGGGSSGYGGGAGRRSSSGSSDYGRDRGSYESRGPRQGFGRSTGDDRGYQGKRFGGDGGEGRSSTPAWQQRGRVPKPRY